MPSQPIRKELIAVRTGIDGQIRKLVLAEEDESARFRRRMHLHLCLIAMAAGLALLSIWSVVDASSAVCLSLGINGVQEYIDAVGRF